MKGSRHAARSTGQKEFFPTRASAVLGERLSAGCALRRSPITRKVAQQPKRSFVRKNFLVLLGYHYM